MRRLGELELYGMRGNANSADRYPLVERHTSQVESSRNFQLVPILFQLDMDHHQWSLFYPYGISNMTGQSEILFSSGNLIIYN